MIRGIYQICTRTVLISIFRLPRPSLYCGLLLVFYSLTLGRHVFNLFLKYCTLYSSGFIYVQLCCPRLHQNVFISIQYSNNDSWIDNKSGIQHNVKNRASTDCHFYSVIHSSRVFFKNTHCGSAFLYVSNSSLLARLVLQNKNHQKVYNLMKTIEKLIV